MKISHRIYILSIGGLLAMGTLCGLNIYQTERVFEATNVANVNTVPSLKTLWDLERDIGTARVRFFKYCFVSDDRQREETLALWKEAKEGVEKALKEYQASNVADAEDGRLIGLVRDKATVVLDHEAAIMKERAANPGKPVSDELVSKERDDALQLQNLVMDDLKYNIKLSDLGEGEARATKHSAILAGIGILLAVGLAFVAQAQITVRLINRKLADANRVAGLAAEGNFKRQGLDTDAGNDEIATLLVSLDHMRSKLAGTLSEIVAVADGVRQSSDGLSAASEQTASASQQGSQVSSQSAAAIEELTVSIDQISRNASEASSKAELSRSLAQSSAASVQASEINVADVAKRVEFTSEQVGALATDIQEITAITTVIREMAEQTNLLALNAAIEAARAGEQGRGFAVVADEVRKLAERTASSVQNITTVIARIRDSSTSVVDSMDSARATVGTALDSARTSAASMKTIAEAAQTLRDLIADISAALAEQRSASTDVSKNVETMAQISEENASAASAVSDTAQNLQHSAQSLREKLAYFQF